MSCDLLITYFCEDRRGSLAKELEINTPVIVGRGPGHGGIRLYEAEWHISRASVEIELTKEGVRVKNLNALDTTTVEVGALRLPSQRLPRLETRIIPDDGEIVIESSHRLLFEIKTKLDFSEIDDVKGPDTLKGIQHLVFDDLYPTYKELCAALVVSWFKRDLNGISPRTTPTNQQLAVLLDCGTVRAAAKRIEHTKERIDLDLGKEFFGQDSKQQMADWIIENDFVSLENVEALPGLKEFVND